MFGRANRQQDAAQSTEGLGLGRTLETITRQYKRKEALRFEGKVYSYQEVEENVNRLASGLEQLGIQQGDRVALMLPNIPEFVFAFYGIQKLGAVAVPFNTMYKGREISFILRDSGARAIICLSNFANLINEIKDDCPDLEHVIITGQRTLVFVDPDSTANVQMVFEQSQFPDAGALFRTLGAVMVDTFRGLGVTDAWYKHQGAVRAANGKKLATILISTIENLYAVNIVAFLGPMDQESLFRVVYVPPEIKDKALEPMSSVQELTGKTVTVQDFRDALAPALLAHMEVELEEGKLTRDETMAYEKNRSLASRI